MPIYSKIIYGPRKMFKAYLVENTCFKSILLVVTAIQNDDNSQKFGNRTLLEV